MNNSELLKEIEELKQKISKLENSCIDKQEYTRWKGCKYQPYWVINDEDGATLVFEECGDKANNYHYISGNYFKTREEAEEYKENLITKQKLKDLALRLNKGVEIDWDDQNQLKSFIVLNHNTKSLCCERYLAFQCLNVICCLDKNFLDIAKKEIGEEALIKLIKSGV